MKICSISDSHNKHRNLIIPDSDILICSGDISFRGEQNIVEDFISWFGQQKAKNKILIFGNHEVGYSNHTSKKYLSAQKLLKDNNIHYLQNSEVIIDGIKFWGSPATPFFGGWEWNYHRGKDIKKVWDKIPDDTNVLITHGPPYSILDLVELHPLKDRDPHQGCYDLLNKIHELKELKAHCFGHLHSGYGSIVNNNVTYVNASVCDERYQANNSPIVFTI